MVDVREWMGELRAENLWSLLLLILVIPSMGLAELESVDMMDSAKSKPSPLKNGRLLSNPFGILGHRGCDTRVYNREMRGVCFNEVECLLKGGAFNSYCDPSVIEGVCCVFVVNRCRNAVVRQRVSYYTNPSFPATEKSPSVCQLHIQPLPNVCWIRFDLIHFSLHSNAAGTCDLDTFTILNSPDGTGGRFCGQKANFATVVRTHPKQGLDVATVTQSNGYMWNVKITQLNCDQGKIEVGNEETCGKRANDSLNTLRNLRDHQDTEAKPRSLKGRRLKRRRRRRKLSRTRRELYTEKNKRAMVSKLERSMGSMPSAILKKKLSSELFFPSFSSRDLFCESKFRVDNTDLKALDDNNDIATSKIIDGMESQVNAYPWMASLMFQGEHFCGGSLVTNRHIITAAHCMEFGNLAIVLNRDLQVSLGDHDVTKANETENVMVNIKRVTFYPSWFNDPGAAGDLAILTLEKAVQLQDNIGTLCLPQDEKATFEMMTGLAIGWGITETGSVSPVLREVMVNILSNATCVANLASLSVSVQSDMICTFGGPKGTESICSGDSGGPLMVLDAQTGRFLLVGVTSFSISDCTAPFPAVFSRITFFLQWIAAVMESERHL